MQSLPGLSSQELDTQTISLQEHHQDQLVPLPELAGSMETLSPSSLNIWFSTNFSSDHPILLILDNHEAHISLGALDIAKTNGIIMLTIPPHMSHRLQLLDKSVLSPFKTYYNRALDSWTRSNPGKAAKMYQIHGCVNESFNDITQHLLWILIHRDFPSQQICFL